MIVDGGSTDGSAEIIERYAPWLAYWWSGRDGGQVAAINNGLARATGDWRTWLNSDDFYVRGALIRVGGVSPSVAWCVGETGYTDIAGRHIGRFPRSYRARSLVGDGPFTWIDVLCASSSGTALPQQSSFWSGAAHATVGPLDESLTYVFEHDLWVRLSHAGFAPLLVADELTLYRIHPEQKTRGGTRAAAFVEEASVTDRWLDRCPREHRSILRGYRRWCLRRARAARGRRLVGLVAVAGLKPGLGRGAYAKPR